MACKALFYNGTVDPQFKAQVFEVFDNQYETKYDLINYYWFQACVESIYYGYGLDGISCNFILGFAQYGDSEYSMAQIIKRQQKHHYKHDESCWYVSVTRDLLQSWMEENPDKVQILLNELAMESEL